MKHKLLLYGMSVMVAGVLVWACRHERFGADDPDAVKPTLTVGEAQDFFEWQYAQSLPTMTRASGDRPVGMLPGDFTPLWNKARIGANREMDGADVPIDPHFIFTAVFHRKTETGDTLRQMVDITQKLVVKKWRDTADYRAFCYIASIVPTPEYYARHKDVAREFRYAGSKGEFSGFVVYQTLEGVPVAVTDYRRGQAVRHDYFPQVTPENADSVMTVMDEVMEGVSFQAGTPRMFGLGTEQDPLESEEVTVTAQRTHTNNPWRITITLTPRPTGLPTGNPNPSDITYITPNVPSGGGGYSNTSTQRGKPTNFDNDCSGDKSTVKAAASNMFSIMQQLPSSMYGSPTFDDFMNKVRGNSSVEHSMVMKTDFQSNLTYFGNINSANGPDDFVGVENNRWTTAIVHSHPDNHLTPPSPLDVWDLGDQLAKGNEGVQANYVIVGTDVYCLQVTDPDKAKAFSAANPIDQRTSMFADNTPAGGLWEKGIERMSSMTSKDQYCATMAYVLSQADAGIMLLRINPNTKTFEALGVTTNSKGQFYPTRCR